MPEARPAPGNRRRRSAEQFLEDMGLGGFYVYRMYDAANRLLYVGFSNNVKARMRQHYNDHAWVDRDVVRIEISDKFAQEKAARVAERDAIANEHPRENGAPARGIRRWAQFIERFGRDIHRS